MASGLKTFMWTAAAVAAIAFMPHAFAFLGTSAIASAVGWAIKAGTVFFAASHAWKSHKENQALAAYGNAPSNDVVYSSGLSRQQERAMAIAQMQGDQAQDEGTYWRDRARAASQEAGRY